MSGTINLDKGNPTKNPFVAELSHVVIKLSNGTLLISDKKNDIDIDKDIDIEIPETIFEYLFLIFILTLPQHIFSIIVNAYYLLYISHKISFQPLCYYTLFIHSIVL